MTYKHSKEFINKQYNKYVELYKQSQSATEAKGYKMISPKLSRNDFGQVYQAYHNTSLEKGAYSKGIVNEIVRDQTLGLKRKNAAAFARQTWKLPAGKRMSLEEVQHLGHEELAKLYNSELSEAYYAAMAGGKSSKDAKLWVSQTWFGSE